MAPVTARVDDPDRVTDSPRTSASGPAGGVAIVVAGRTSTGTVVDEVLVVDVLVVDVLVVDVLVVDVLVVDVLVVDVLVVDVVLLVVVGTVVLVVLVVVLLVVVGTVVLVVLVDVLLVVDVDVVLDVVVVLLQSGGSTFASDAVRDAVRTTPERSVTVPTTSLVTVPESSHRGTLVWRQISGGGPLNVTCS